jgi:hypothetical protein
MATATARRTTTKRNAAIAVAMFTLPELAKGEIYAGVLLDEKGKPAHHLVLLAGQRDNFTWEEAKKWAAAQGGELPSRKEQALLFANAAQHFERDWYWSSEQYASDPSYAWMQYFSNGGQYCYHTSSKYRARAVRRVPIR